MTAAAPADDLTEPAERVAPFEVPHAARNPAAPMEFHEKTQMRAAAFRAKRLYPGPVGELISDELLAWEDFGFRLDRNGLVARLVRHVMTTPDGTIK